MKIHVRNYLRYFDIGEQDVWFCEYCGVCRPINNGLEIHHIVYRSQGGTDDIENICCLCRACHNAAHAEKLTGKELTEIHLKFMNYAKR